MGDSLLRPTCSIHTWEHLISFEFLAILKNSVLKMEICIPCFIFAIVDN